jgi:hypothetical protein
MRHSTGAEPGSGRNDVAIWLRSGMAFRFFVYACRDPKTGLHFWATCICLPYGAIGPKRPVPALHSSPVEHYANRLTLLLAVHLFRRKRFATRREPVGSGSYHVRSWRNW